MLDCYNQAIARDVAVTITCNPESIYVYEVRDSGNEG